MFTKDSRTENMLNRFGIEWKYSNDIVWSDLAPQWQATNKGRSKARVDEIVLEYAQRMEDGSAAPAPVLRDTIAGLDPLDGVQRLCAEEIMGSTRFSGYITKTDSEVLAVTIRVLANKLLAGHPEPEEWTRRHTVSVLVIDGGMSSEEVARLGGWKAKDIEDEKTNLEWGFKLRCAGGPEKMPKNILLSVARKAQLSDLAFKPAVEFIADLQRAKFTNGESEPFISKFFDIKRGGKDCHKRFESHLEDFRKDTEVKTRLEGRQISRRLPDVKLLAAMRSVKTIVDGLAAKKEVAIPYIDECFQLLNQIRKSLTQLQSHQTERTARQ
jgi:hypothetical protein